MRGPGERVTVTGTGHCPPVTLPPAPAPINREMPLSGPAEVTLHPCQSEAGGPGAGQSEERVGVITSTAWGHVVTRGPGSMTGRMSRVTCHVLSHSDQVRFAENIVLHF